MTSDIKLHCEDCQHHRHCQDAEKVDASDCFNFDDDYGASEDIPSAGIKYIPIRREK